MDGIDSAPNIESSRALINENRKKLEQSYYKTKEMTQDYRKNVEIKHNKVIPIEESYRNNVKEYLKKYFTI